MQWDKLIWAVGKWLPEWSQMKGRGLKERYMTQVKKVVLEVKLFIIFWWKTKDMYYLE